MKKKKTLRLVVSFSRKRRGKRPCNIIGKSERKKKPYRIYYFQYYIMLPFWCRQLLTIVKNDYNESKEYY